MMGGRAKQLILDIIENPARHQDHAKQYVIPSNQKRIYAYLEHRYAASVVMLLAYGVLPNGCDDPDVRVVNECLTRLGNNMRPGLWMVDYWPFLR